MPDDPKKSVQARIDAILKQRSGETEELSLDPDLSRPDFWETFNQPVTTFKEGLGQLSEGNIPTGGMNIFRSGLEFLATPFTTLDEGLRQGEKFIDKNIVEPLGLTNKDLGIGKTPTTSEIVGAPFQLTAEGVDKGTRVIEEGLKQAGVDTKKFDADMVKYWQSQGLMPEGDPNKLADEFTKSGLALNQIIAQFAVGGELFKTAGQVIKGATGVESLSPIKGIKAIKETKQTRQNIKDIESGKLNIDLEKEALALKEMLEGEQPLTPKSEGKQTRLEKDAKTPIDKGKKLSEDKASILEHDLSLIENLETKPPEFFKPNTLERITSEIKKSETRRGKFDQIAEGERSQRYAKLQSAIESKVTGSDKVIKMLASQKGKFKQPDFEPIKITDAEIESLVNRVVESPKLDGYEKLQTSLILNEVIGNPKLQTEGGRVPTNRELILLEKVFGKDFTEAIKSHKGKWQNFKEQFKDNLVDVLNIPRAIMASADMSAPLRQGLAFTITKPKQSIPALGRMVKQFFSDEFFKIQREKIENSTNKELYDVSKLEFTEAGTGGKLSAKEEAFMTQIAEKLPFGIGGIIRASERAFVGYLNDIRASVFDNITENFKKSGIDPKTQPKVYEDLAQFINLATGRGKVPPKLREMTPLLNNLFFSIRNNLAKVQLPAMLLDFRGEGKGTSPAVRKEMAKTLVQSTGVIMSVLTIAKLAGADVETDPKSSDFAKIKMGNTRIDLLAGNQQLIRTIAQIGTDSQKNLSTGKVTTSDEFPFRSRLERALTFVRSKLSPSAGIGVNLLAGKTFLGDEVSLANQTEFIPFAVKDIYEAVQDQGVNGLFLGIPAFFGASLQTFKPKRNSNRR